MISKKLTQIQYLLQQISYILRNFLSKKIQNHQIETVKIEKIAQQVQNLVASSQKILSQIINNIKAEQILKILLIDILKQTMSVSKIVKLCKIQIKSKKQAYSIVNTNSVNLITDIIKNIKLIQQQMINLSTNIQSLQQEYLYINSIHHAQLQQIQLYHLLAIVMEDSQIQLPEALSQLVFRMYILQESISLIFYKANIAFQQLIALPQEDQKGQRNCELSCSSDKLSALSQSIEVFKQRQRREQLQRFEIYRELDKQNVIKSNYQFFGPKNKQTKHKKSKNVCCFNY